ncbi:MAG TPA: hypothetical protein DCM86_02065, partial [Verrucomicrobiales bacterium]|nr:hypothetical protein [Verrucomicrobiales bacterium]
RVLVNFVSPAVPAGCGIRGGTGGGMTGGVTGGGTAGGTTGAVAGGGVAGASAGACSAGAAGSAGGCAGGSSCATPIRGSENARKREWSVFTRSIPSGSHGRTGDWGGWESLGLASRHRLGRRGGVRLG